MSEYNFLAGSHHIPADVQRSFDSYKDPEQVKDFFINRQIGMSSKFAIKFRDKSSDVYGSWLHRDILHAFNRISWYESDYEGNYHIHGLPEDWEGGNKFRHFYYMWVVCQSSTFRSKIDDVLKTLVMFPTYKIGIDLRTKLAVPPEHFRLIKDDHGSKGFYSFKLEDSLWAINKTPDDNKGNIFALGDNLKKVAQRVTKLTPNRSTTYIGTYRAFVMEDVPEEIKPLFNTGAIYTPRSIVERLGLMRLISPYGTKGVTMPLTDQMEEINKNIFIFSKGSFKGNMNGVYALKSGKSFRECMGISTKGQKRYLKKHREVFGVQGHKVYGWFVDIPLYASTFYALYGLKDVEGDEFMQSSFYLDALRQVEEDYDAFNLIHHVRQSSMVNKFPILHVKTQEVRNVKFSYSDEQAQKFATSVITSGNKYIRERTHESMKLLSKKLKRKDAVKVDRLYLERVSRAVWPRMIPTGPLDLSDDKVKMLLDGGNLGGVQWDGLRTGRAKFFIENGARFYIPGGKTMDEYIHEEEGTTRVMFSGPAREFIFLMIGLRNKSMNIKAKSIQHMASVQRDMLGDTIDKWPVMGSGNKVLLPGFWLKPNEVVCTDGRFKDWEGKTVMFSKMPVLFNKAVTGLKFSRWLSREYYSNLSPDLLFALNDGVIAPTQLLLDHQNDCDGDLGRIAYLGDDAIPEYDGLPDHMHAWRDNYVEGENDLALSFDEVKEFTTGEISEAMNEMIESKEATGSGTNSLFYLETVLESFIHDGEINREEAILLRDAYSMAFQDDIVRGIKHLKGGRGFADALMHKVMFFEESIEEVQPGRAAFKKLVDIVSERDLDDVVDTMFVLWDDMVENPHSPAASRRSGTIKKLTTRRIEFEDDLDMLDILTRSYLSSTEGMFHSYSYMRKTEGLLDFIEENYEDIMNKYILLGKNLVNVKADHAFGCILNAWLEVNG